MSEISEHPAASPKGTSSVLKSWKFWAVMGVLAGLCAMFVYGFGKNPKLVPSPLVGKPAPGFSVKEMDTGQPVSLESLKGTPFVLNFFASWCISCRDEAHLLEQAYLRWGQDPSKLRMIGIAVQDTPEKARAFAKRYGKTYFLGLDDTAGDISLNYGVYGVPETFFVNAQGIIQYKQIGPVSTDVLDREIPKLIASKGKS